MVAALLIACGSDDDSGLRAIPEVTTWTAAADVDGDAIVLTPATALRGDSAYAVVVTTDLRDTDSRPFTCSVDFAAVRGGSAPDAGRPMVGYSDDLDSDDNPYPDARLVDTDGKIHIPDRFALRGVRQNGRPDSMLAEEILRDGVRRLETLSGYSTTGPIRIALSAAADLATASDKSILLFERDDAAVDLAGLLRVTDEMGINRDDIALAFSFPTQTIESDLLAVQSLLRERAAGMTVAVDIVDHDPDDDLPLGVFDAGDPDFAATFAQSPALGRIVAGIVRSPDFRGPEEIWLPERISGQTQAPEQDLDFLLALPAAGSPPYPIVLLRHGFGGTNEIVLDLAQIFAAKGLATIGIDAVAHGRRGDPLDLLRARPFVARDIFRQTIADQMAVLRAVEVGIDIDEDGEPDLDPDRMSYLGISLGGILGATLVAVEDILPTAVLNVAGGRVSFLGQSEGLRDLVQGSLAAEVMLERDDLIFEAYIRRILETGQHAVDPVDGLNYARRWFVEPLPGRGPSRVLVQEGIGDRLVDNESTEALARAGGLVANTPMSDPAGVSGLWRFEPPGGHGIFAREDVQRQALEFLTSTGTEIIDRGAPVSE